MSIEIDKLAHMNTPALSDILLAHSAAEGTGVIAIGDLPELLNAGNLKMPDSDETIAEHYRQFCNRNLLDNWYFANPVNQKGQIEFTGSGYTIDRWRSYGAKVSINDEYISLSTEGNPTFCQKSEFDLYDKTLTFSVLLANGSLCTGTGILASGTAWKNTTLYEDSSIKLWLQNSDPLFNAAIDIKGNTPVDMVAAKLEFGSSQTLAHKEGSKWVLNEIPDYATELAKCQRYLRVFESLPNGYITAGGTNFISYIPALSSMRSNPTIVLENLSIALRLPSGYSTLASFDKPLQIVNNVYVGSTRFYLISNEAFGENNVPASVEFRSGRIIFSSEL